MSWSPIIICIPCANDSITGELGMTSLNYSSKNEIFSFLCMINASKFDEYTMYSLQQLAEKCDKIFHVNLLHLL